MASVVQLKDAVELGRGLGLRGGGEARGGDGWGAGAAAEKAQAARQLAGGCGAKAAVEQPEAAKV